MISFRILKQSTKSRARIGVLKTSHGDVETPTLVPVATQAAVKAMTVDQVLLAGTHMLIANTYHLHLRPGEDIIRRSGGVHRFMHWERPLMTDSGGFQVFSHGFGKDFGITKMAKGERRPEIRPGSQPIHLQIGENGVTFRSPVDGTKLFLGPKESMAIQAALASDIAFAFDECPPPIATRAYHEESLERTHRWAEVCIRHHAKTQALYGIVQGGKYPELRKKSAKFIGGLPFDGFGIGGEFGPDRNKRERMLEAVFQELPEERPRHLLGTGYPEDILSIIKAGVDTFDSIVPTHYARRGIAFTANGRLDLKKQSFLKDRRPLDPTCSCATCAHYSRGYLAHLVRAHEITPLTLVSFHNLSWFHGRIADIRKKIRLGKI
ncbi:MAG: hypothetical protein A3B37_02385 [Candidatus Sungbacteria bacterium RIFCSPLOWO2_01_FULL_59_16]|uniref:Queuine tRNA-ribosyltransferase n=1 Tax=Candidatus Sungbacteria bacterium RIFCSPLOWO2_01_FULL_59_16 TaxID=1802280 RepID=A0A1G2LCP3_9BACT|nr:MAG: hypothetical protein A3B37_02385 [Candidatus Sungbacteria bacterium RIFCSPLOWO2_01_FULL_59_16]